MNENMSIGSGRMIPQTREAYELPCAVCGKTTNLAECKGNDWCAECDARFIADAEAEISGEKAMRNDYQMNNCAPPEFYK